MVIAYLWAPLVSSKGRSKNLAVRDDSERKTDVVEVTTVLVNLALVAYPVLTLPSDIVSRILSNAYDHTAESDLPLPQLHSSSRRYAATGGTSLCLLRRPPRGTKASDSALCLLKLWVSRAKDCPLSFGIDRNPDELSSLFFMAAGIAASSESEVEKNVAPEFLVFVSSLSSQIWRLEAHLSPKQFTQIQSPHRPFPLLQWLACPCAPEAGVRDILEEIPSLRALHLLSPGSTIDFSSRLLMDLQIEPSVAASVFFAVFTNFPALLLS
ncbi:hypothetical protein B0H16DRAFT_1720442 [Mycena metata]|uniref:F-box domain-containing protein n=1 Tax=Mycena metata TaxID=1033252 RepID=A0AAD7NH42_9AGAR|nr:hypothetical protein B0H16DRAFT_1720442 [Mycena metata]